MAQIVRLKDEGIAIRFPDDMSPSDIETVIRTQIYGQDVIKNVPPEEEQDFYQTMGLTTQPVTKKHEDIARTHPQYGLRADGTIKGPGFLGALKRPDGKVSTELSIGVNIGGKEVEIPVLVPTLTEDEINYLLKGGRPTKEIVNKAVAHARKRIEEGKSPFLEWSEIISSQTTPLQIASTSKTMNPKDIARAQIELEAKQRGMSPEAYKESVLRGKKPQETKQKTTQGQGSVLSDLLDDVEIGVVTPVLQFNELIGLGELNKPWYERFRQKTERMEAGPTRDWKLTHRIIQGVSGLLPQIGMDVMTGGATKALTAERLVPWASKLLDMIPSFALGWGVREAASEGKEAIKGKEAPVTVATKILQGLGEGISKGMLWESLGTLNRAGRWLGLPALTTADTVYEKIKRGQPITKDDILDSAAEGLAYSALFEGMPQLFQYGKRKVAEAQFKRLSEPIKKTVFNDLRDQLIEGRSLGKLTDKDLHKYEKKYPELLKDIKYKAFKNVKNVVETGKDDSGNPIDINELLNDDRIKALGLDKSIHQMRGETVPEEPSPPVTEGESAFLDILEKTLKSPKKTTTEEATVATEQLAKPEEKATPPTDETKLSSEQIKISKKEKLTKEDVGNILAKQPLNKGKSHKDLVDKWVSSDNFTLMDIPVDSVGMATEPKDIPRTEGPIIVDENINEIGRYKGRYGAPPDVIVLDGKHRLAKAIQNGEKTIKAYVGDKAIPHLKEAIKQFNKKQQDITKAVISYWEKPNGTTLRELSIVLSDKDKINKIREARKAFSEGRLSSLDVFKEYKNEPWANEALNKLRSELTKKKTTNRVLNGGKLIEVKPDGSDSIFRIEGRNVEVLSKKEKAGTGEQVKEYKQPWEMTKKEWNKKLTRDNVFAEKVIEDIKNMGVNVSPAGDVYITSRTDIDELADKYPLMSVRVKDVNGHRATINITNFAKLAKVPAFTDRVRSVQLYLQYYPEEKGSGFMDNIFETGQRKLLQRKEKRTTEPIKLVEGIDYINNSTITRTKQAEFISALTNPRVQKYLKRYGIKKFIIDPPYKFELSEQANIDKKRRVLRINADVDDPVNSILHEIGHLEYDKLSKEKRRKWASILSRIHNKAVDGYKKLNLPEEAYAETFAHQGEPWADEALKKLSEAKLTPKEAKEGEEKAKEEKLPVPATSRPKAKMTQDQIEVINGAIDLHKYYLNRGGETLLHLEEAAKEGIIPKELVKPILDRIVQLERQGKLGETGAEWRYSVKKVREYFDDILAEKGFEVATTPKEEARQKKEKSSVLPPEVIKEIKKLEAELDKIKKEYNLKQSLRGLGAIGQTKETALLWDKMQEIKKKIDALKAPIREVEWKRIEEEDRAKREAWAKKREKEVAEAPVFRRVNGWEIVKHSGDYVVRDPYTKEDVYRSSRYKRAEEVAKESKPEKPAAKEAEQKEKQIQKEIPKPEVEPKPEETKKEEKKRLEKEAEAPPEYVIKYDEMPAQIAHEPYTPAVQDKVKRMVNKMRLAVKDFQKAPVFTVVKGDRGNLRLGFTDSYRFKFWPEVFNINGAELKEGQKIRIDLDSFKKKRRKLSYEKSILADKDKAYTGNGVTIAGDIAYASQVTNEPKRGVLIHNLPKEEIEKINQKMLGELLPSFDTTVKAEETTKIEDLDSGRYFLKVGENAYIPYKAAKFFASNSDKPLMFEYDSKAEKKFAGVKAGDRLIGFVGVYEDIRHSNEELPNGLPKPKKANEGKFGDLRELLTGEFSTQEKKGVSDAGIERESKTARKVLQGKRIKEAKGEKRLTYSDPVAEKHLRNWADSTIKDKGDVKEVREAVDATIDAIDKLPPKTKKLMEQLTIEHKRPPIVIRKDFSGIPDEFIGTYKQAAAVTVNRMRIDIPPGKKPTESVLRHELVHFKWNDLDSSKNSKAQELIKIAYEEAVEDASRAIKYAFSSKAKKEAQELINKNDPWLHDSIKYIKQRALSMARKAKKTPGKDITFSLELDLMVGGEHDVQRLIKHISGIEYPTDVSTIAFYNALARRYDLKLSESYGKEEFAAYKAGVDKEFAEELLGTLVDKKKRETTSVTLSFLGTQQLYDALSKSKTIKELGEELNKIRAVVSPTGVSEKAKTGAAIRRGNIGRATLIRNAFVQKAQPYSKAFQALPDDLQMEISMQIEEGRANKENLAKAGVPEKIAEVAERYAKFHKKTMDFVWKALNDRGLLNEYIENYLSHIWKKPDEATKKFNDIFQKRPLSGNKYYLKKRVIDYYRTGIEQLGLKPKYTNPVDIDTAYIAQALKLISIHDTIQELKDIGAWKFVKKGQKPPEGFAKVDDPVADVWFRTEKGLVSPGNYYAPADIARILNNEASRGLYGRSKAYDLLRETNTAWNMANLGMSGYHATFSHITWATHYGALGVSELLKGDFKLAARNLIKAIPGVNLPAFAKDIKRGEYLRKLVLNPELAKTPWEKTFIQWCEWVNADPKLDRYYALSAWEDMTKLIRQKKYIKALPKLPLAIIELSSKLIMEHLVPDLKYVSFADLLEHELERKAPKNELEARKIATEVYDMVEDRFGQMTYDNLFWDRRLKDILMLSLRSVGWNYGDIREVAGATENVGQIVKGMIMEKKLPRNKDLSNRVIFVMMVPIVAGLYGAAYEYLHGVKIKSEFDLIAPRTGRKNEDGSDERVMFASYLKDWIALVKEHHRGRIIRNKLSPVLNTLINLWENEDYWGNEIYGADNKLQDIAKYVIKQWPPFSIQGYKKMREHGATVKEALEPSAGITLAPKYITNTPAQEYIYETYHKLKGIRTKEEQPEFEWKREFRKELKETGRINKELLHEGIKKHYIRSRRGIQSLLRSSKKSPDVFMLTTLKTVHQVKALLLARDDEIPKYYLAVSRAARKILRKEYPERYRHIIKVLKDMKKRQK